MSQRGKMIVDGGEDIHQTLKVQSRRQVHT